MQKEKAIKSEALGWGINLEICWYLKDDFLRNAGAFLRWFSGNINFQKVSTTNMPASFRNVWIKWFCGYFTRFTLLIRFWSRQACRKFKVPKYHNRKAPTKSADIPCHPCDINLFQNLWPWFDCLLFLHDFIPSILCFEGSDADFQPNQLRFNISRSQWPD